MRSREGIPALVGARKDFRTSGRGRSIPRSCPPSSSRRWPLLDIARSPRDPAFMNESTTISRSDLSVELAGIRMNNPLMTASGTSGYGPEYAPLIDINELGAFVTKAVTVKERPGNPQPRTFETASGMLNAIGLANVGLERFCTEKIP
jgi:hypothetical protein